MKINDIVKFLEQLNINYTIDGNTEKEISGYSSIFHYRENTITWLKGVYTLERTDFPMSSNYTCVIT